MRITLVALVLSCSLGALSLAESPSRWVPEHCVAHVEMSDAERNHSVEGDAEERWNESYRRGFRAIEGNDYFVAETEMCRALLAARDFDARDWRFAETLDE